MLKNSNLKFADSLEQSIKFGDIVFVAIQTPHIAKYGGQCPIPDERVDFDYTWLINCIKQISEVLDRIEENKIVTIISTVLPGTLRKYIFPVMSKELIYVIIHFLLLWELLLMISIFLNLFY